MFCPNCGCQVNDRQLFCHTCGASLAEYAAPKEPKPEEAPVVAEEAPPVPVEEALPAPTEAQDESLQPLYDTSVFAHTTPEQPPAPLQPADSTPKGRHLPAVLIMSILVLVGTLLFFLFPAKEANVTHSADGVFTVTDGTLSFNASAYTGGESLTVPAVVDGQQVTALANNCFKDCTSLTEIILPRGLTAIGTSAFSGCTGLRGIYLPEGLKTIGMLAFANCEALEAICIPKSVMDVGEGAFSFCTKLRHIFYFGELATWQRLYPELINNSVTVYTPEGAYVGSG